MVQSCRCSSPMHGMRTVHAACQNVLPMPCCFHAARCRVLGVESWVTICIRSLHKKTGLPSVVDSICKGESGVCAVKRSINVAVSPCPVSHSVGMQGH